MKNIAVVTLVLTAALMSTGCPRRVPDLVVTQFILNGQPTLNQQGDVEVPVVVQVENQGNGAAPVFLLTASYEGTSGTVVVPFTVEGQTDTTYPSTSEPLAAGDQVVLSGILTVSEHNTTLPFYVLADSCTGDTTHPDYCRVNETDEDNNTAGPLNVLLP